jgi:hypothetical protein
MPIYCVEFVGEDAVGVVYVGTSFEDAAKIWNDALVSDRLAIHMTVWENGMRTLFSDYEMSRLKQATFVDCIAIRGINS